jgi:hypothetical protein
MTRGGGYIRVTRGGRDIRVTHKDDYIRVSIHGDAHMGYAGHTGDVSGTFRVFNIYLQTCYIVSSRCMGLYGGRLSWHMQHTRKRFPPTKFRIWKLVALMASKDFSYFTHVIN